MQMPIFLVTPLARNFSAVKEAISKAGDAADWMELQNQAGFLVSFKGTSIELSNLIGITSADRGQPSTLGSAMVTTVASYYGRGPTDMWEWLKTRFESQS